MDTFLTKFEEILQELDNTGELPSARFQKSYSYQEYMMIGTMQLRPSLSLTIAKILKGAY